MAHFPSTLFAPTHNSCALPPLFSFSSPSCGNTHGQGQGREMEERDENTKKRGGREEGGEKGEIKQKNN